MSKGKRNIILIFGFILIVNFMFFPCNQIKYSIGSSAIEDTGIMQWGGELQKLLKELRDEEGEAGLSEFLKKLDDNQKLKLIDALKASKSPQFTLEELQSQDTKRRRVSHDYVKVFFPLVISRANKYKKYIKWEDSVLLMLEKKTKVRTELEGEWNRLLEGRRTISSEELLLGYDDDKAISALKKKKGLSQLTKVNIKIYEINEEIRAIKRNKIKEFREKSGYNPYFHYHQIKVGGFFIELGLLIFIGCLAFATLVGLKAFRVALRKKGERGTNRMKRRKAGIILILIGIGIPLALAPFVSRGWVDILEIEFKYFLFIGIVLFLIGTGKVIFSFFPKDANPKK